MNQPTPPRCAYLASISVQVGPAIEVGETSEGISIGIVKDKRRFQPPGPAPKMP